MLVVFSSLPERELCFSANLPNRAKFSSFYLALSLLAPKKETSSWKETVQDSSNPEETLESCTESESASLSLWLLQPGGGQY